MQKKMKVLQYIPGFRYGGIESNILNICRHASKEGKVHFDLLVERQSKTISFAAFEELGCNIYQIDKIDFLKPWRYYRKIFKIIESGGYDIVHAYNITRSPLLFLAAKKSGVKIRIFHASTTLTSTNIFGKIIYRIFIKVATSLSTDLMACSDNAGEYFFGKGKATIFNNGVQSERLVFNQEIREKIRNKLNIHNSLLVGHVGRFCEAKNHEFIIDVFNSVLKKNSDAHLFLIGDGPLMELIKDKVNALEIEGKVHFFGQINNANEYYQAMDILLFPSIYEGFPTVVTEAQAAGLRVIASTNITPKVMITDLVEFVSLKSSCDDWADKIISRGSNYIRENTQEIIINCGYDVVSNVEFLQNHYINLYTKVYFSELE